MQGVVQLWTSDVDKQAEPPSQKSNEYSPSHVSVLSICLSCCIHTQIVLCSKAGLCLESKHSVAKHVGRTPAILCSLTVDATCWVSRKRRRRSYNVSQQVTPVVHSTALIDSSLLCLGTDRQKEEIGSMIHDIHSMPSMVHDIHSMLSRYSQLCGPLQVPAAQRAYQNSMRINNQLNPASACCFSACCFITKAAACCHQILLYSTDAGCTADTLLHQNQTGTGGPKTQKPHGSQRHDCNLTDLSTKL